MELYFEEELVWSNHKAQMIRRINEMGLPLVIFGRVTGANPDFLEEVKVPVEFVVSTHPTSWGKKLWGLECVGLDRVQEAYSAWNVLILCVHYSNELIPMLEQLPVPPSEIFQLDLRFEQKGTAEYLRSVQLDIQLDYDRFADEKSKNTFEALLRYRINRDPAFLKPVACPEEEEYFPEELGERRFLGSEEVFVDVGAYTGDTVLRFRTAVKERYRRIFAFEPDPQNYKKLVESTAGIRDVTCRQVGASDTPARLRFASNGQTSRPVESGDALVEIDTLDHQLSGVDVTFIKMDIEGMECPALRGARQLIQSCRPKLAICSYHSMEDMVFVPKLIAELNPAYHIYLRHYCESAIEQTICYAVI